MEGWKDGRMEEWAMRDGPPRKLSSGNAAARGTASPQSLKRFEWDIEGSTLPFFHSSILPFFQRAAAQKPISIILLTVLRVLCASVVKFLRFEIDFHFQVGPATIP
jgi:hypothetical protein